MAKRNQSAARRIDERVPGESPHGAPEVVGGALGAAAGAVAGAMAGPPGAVVGAIVGAFAGAISGVAVEGPSEKELRDEELDRAIGVTEGDIGAPNLLHPPSYLGRYTVAAEAVSDEEGVAEERKQTDGPIENIED